MYPVEPYAIFDKDGRVVYVGLHGSDADCWQVYLGWPSDEEIDHARNVKREVCARVSVKKKDY